MASGFGVAHITQKHTDERQKNDFDQAAKEDIKEMEKRHKTELDEFKKETAKNFEDLKDTMNELRALFQQTQAVNEINMKNLTDEVREHNNFAKRMPVVEEQIKVANHRIDDLERAERGRS